MVDKIKEFGNTAKTLARNPLGIIALFIVLVYGIAALVCVSDKLNTVERTILILFLIVFPCIVLRTFYLLVTKHYNKLYSPMDYKDETNYLKSIDILTQKETVDNDEKKRENAFQLEQNYTILQEINDKLEQITELANTSETLDVQNSVSNVKEILGEIEKTMDWSEYHIYVNDLIPDYWSITKFLKKSNIVLWDTFGSTSQDPSTPEVVILAFGEDINVDNLKFFVQNRKELRIEGIYYSPSSSISRRKTIYLGSYNYKLRKYAVLSNILSKRLLDANNYEEFRKIVIENYEQ